MFAVRLNRKLFEDTKRWKKEGAYLKLLNPNPDTDKFFFESHFKDASEITTPEFDMEKDKLSIAGIANANIIDRVEERVDPRGAELGNFAKNPQLLAHHNYRDPIGQVDEVELEEGGMNFKAWIGDPSKAPLTEKQKEIRSLVKQGILKTVSIGFIPKKIKSPLFNDDGSIKEGPIIEQWELLEISVVAVPCNQDSVFEIRSLENSKGTATVINSVKEKSMKIINSFNKKTKEEIASILQDLEKAESMVLQTLIFDKTKFSKEEAIKWAKDNNFRSEGIDETEDSFRIRQRNPEDFDPNTFRTIDITEGVKGVVGKLKGENMGEDPNKNDNKDDNFKGEVLTILRGVDVTAKRIHELTEKLVAKSEEKPQIDEEPGKPGKPCDENKPKELQESVLKIKKQIEQLTVVIGLLVEKDIKK